MREKTATGKLVWLLTVLLLIAGTVAEAQQGKVYRVGLLGPPARERAQVQGLRDGLRETGYLEGNNLLLKIPAVNTYGELRPIAKGYVQEKMDVIVTDGGTATDIARKATKAIPIIYLGCARPRTVRSSEVSSSSGGQCHRFDLRHWRNFGQTSGAFQGGGFEFAASDLTVQC